MIKINKQLQRKDGGPVASGSIIDFTPRFPTGTMDVIYSLKHWYKESSESDGFTKIPNVTDFTYVQVKSCTEEEFAQLNDAGSADLVQTWLQEIIEAQIGVGKTEIV